MPKLGMKFGKWTLPVEKLQALLPAVNVRRGHQEVSSSALSEALRQYGKQLHQKVPSVDSGIVPPPATESFKE